VRPCNSANRQFRSSGVYSELLGDCLISPEARNVPRAHGSNNIVSQFSGVVKLASLGWVWEWAHSVFGHGVMRVIRFSSKEQVCGIDTQTVVALVADTQRGRRRPIGQFPRNAMRQFLSIIGCPAHTVASDVALGGPRPAIVGIGGLSNLLPEAICQWSYAGFVGALVRAIENLAAVNPLFGALKRTTAMVTGEGDGARMWMHGGPPIRCATPRAVSAAPRLSCVYFTT
jgi:hypothetical protein